MGNFLQNAFYSTFDSDVFTGALQQALNQLSCGGIFVGDNLFTYSRNLSFLEDETFMRSFEANTEFVNEKAVIWRINVLVWAARQGSRLEGDFVECGTYKGTSARIVCDCVDFANLDKKFYLYDLFEHDSTMNHHAMPGHGSGLYGWVTDRFLDLDGVTVVKGAVPDSLSETEPEKISFLHIDMNNVDAEIGALNMLFDRVMPGAFIVLDDYGWKAYRDQKDQEDAFFAQRGYKVLELPTGQGLVIK